VNEDRLLRAPEVAEMLSVPTSWVREQTRLGRIPHITLGRYRRYSRIAISEWLEHAGSISQTRRA
jgi:excisionase family DNA binding protein